MTDETTAYLQAAAAFEEVCSRITESHWRRPGLGEWDVRALVGHTLRAVTTVPDYLAADAPDGVACATPGEYFARIRHVPGADDRSVADRGHRAGAALGPDPYATVQAGVTRARSALRAVEGIDPLIHTVAGGMRLSDYLPTRTLELTVHSLDVAVATGVAFDPPTAAVASTLRTAVDALTWSGDPVGLLRHLLGRPGGALPPLFGSPGR